MYKSKNQSGGITVRIYKFIFPVSLVLAGVSLAKEELHYFYISNHDQSPSHRVIHPIVGKTNFVYDAKGLLEEVRGEGIAFLIRDCENVTIRNLRLDYARPMLTEAKVGVLGMPEVASGRQNVSHCRLLRLGSRCFLISKK